MCFFSWVQAKVLCLTRPVFCHAQSFEHISCTLKISFSKIVQPSQKSLPFWPASQVNQSPKHVKSLNSGIPEQQFCRSFFLLLKELKTIILWLLCPRRPPAITSPTSPLFTNSRSCGITPMDGIFTNSVGKFDRS